MIRTARGQRERGDGAPASARPIPADAKQPAYSAGPIKHLSSKSPVRAWPQPGQMSLTLASVRKALPHA